MSAIVRRRSDLLRLHPSDNVLVLVRKARVSESVWSAEGEFSCPAELGLGQKLAARDIRSGEKILKYGVSIGTATHPIARGDHVHLHNMQSDYAVEEHETTDEDQ